MLRILHPVLCYYPSQAGGPANTLYWLNSALSSDQFSSKIVTTQLGLVNKLDRRKFSETHQAKFLRTKLSKNIIIECLKELDSIDIVQFSSLFFIPTLPLLYAAIRKNRVIIISPRGELYPSALEHKPLRKKLWLRVIKRLQRHINFHATNEIERDFITKHFPEAKSTHVIPNFILFPPRLKLETENKFVFVGRINQIKNIDILIKGFSLLQKTVNLPKTQLFIVGAARLPNELAYEKELKKLVHRLGLDDNIFFSGHLEGVDKDQLLASSKALLLPSRSENFGNVILEALAQGTPVIASKNTPWEILEKENCGYWVDTTPENLASCMIDLLNKDERNYTTMRNNAYNLCKERFDIIENIDIWENYYKTISAHV